MTDYASHWAAPRISRMIRLGVMKGYPGGDFHPDSPATRAELATVADRMIDDDYVKASVKMAAPFTVTVASGGGTGSGVLITPSLVLTAHHVAYERIQKDDGSFYTRPAFPWAVKLSRELGSVQIDAEPAQVDEAHDLCLLKLAMSANVDRGVTVASMPVSRGQTVYCLGAPMGQEDDFSEGEVRHEGRRVTYYMAPQTLRALTVPINPGNSGGPVFNAFGELVGIVAAKVAHLTVDSYTFMVELEDVRKFVEGIA